MSEILPLNTLAEAKAKARAPSNDMRDVNGVKVTPWRTWDEWKWMHGALYDGDDEERRRGLEVMDVWRVRGGIPHGAEMTATLVGVDLFNRLALAMAIVRAVNGVVDREQKSRYAKDVTRLGQGVGLSAWIIELRHRATHNDLPSLDLLRAARLDLLTYYDRAYWRPQRQRLQSAEDAILAYLHRPQQQVPHPTTFAALLVPAMLRLPDDDIDSSKCLGLERGLHRVNTDIWPGAAPALIHAFADAILSDVAKPDHWLRCGLRMTSDLHHHRDIWHRLALNDDPSHDEPRKRLGVAIVADALAADVAAKLHLPTCTTTTTTTTTSKKRGHPRSLTIDEAEERIAPLKRRSDTLLVNR